MCLTSLHALLLGLALVVSGQVSAQQLGEQMDSFGINGSGSAQTTPSRLGEKLRMDLEKQPHTPLWAKVNGIVGNLIRLRLFNSNSARVDKIANERQSLIRTESALVKLDPKIDELMNSLKEQLAGQKIDNDKLDELKKDLRKRFAQLAEQGKLGDTQAVNAAFESAVADHLGKDAATKVAANNAPKENSSESSRSPASIDKAEKVATEIGQKSDAAVAKAATENVDAQPEAPLPADSPSSPVANTAPSAPNLSAPAAPSAPVAAATPGDSKAQTPAPAPEAQKPSAPPVINANRAVTAPMGGEHNSPAPIDTKEPVMPTKTAANNSDNKTPNDPNHNQGADNQVASNDSGDDDTGSDGFGNKDETSGLGARPLAGGGQSGGGSGLGSIIPPLVSVGTNVVGQVILPGAKGGTDASCSNFDPVALLRQLSLAAGQANAPGTVAKTGLSTPHAKGVFDELKGKFSTQCGTGKDGSEKCSPIKPGVADEDLQRKNAFGQRLEMASNLGDKMCVDDSANGSEPFRKELNRIMSDPANTSEKYASMRFAQTFGSVNSNRSTVNYYNYVLCDWLKFRVASKETGCSARGLCFKDEKSKPYESPYGDACYNKDVKFTARLLKLLQQKASECGYAPAAFDYFSSTAANRNQLAAFAKEPNIALSQSVMADRALSTIKNAKPSPTATELRNGGSGTFQGYAKDGALLNEIFVGVHGAQDVLPQNCGAVAKLYDLVRHKAMSQSQSIAQAVLDDARKPGKEEENSGDDAIHKVMAKGHSTQSFSGQQLNGNE